MPEKDVVLQLNWISEVVLKENNNISKDELLGEERKYKFENGFLLKNPF
jgi:hypothetical protein